MPVSRLEPTAVLREKDFSLGNLKLKKKFLVVRNKQETQVNTSKDSAESGQHL